MFGICKALICTSNKCTENIFVSAAQLIAAATNQKIEHVYILQALIHMCRETGF